MYVRCIWKYTAVRESSTPIRRPPWQVVMQAGLTSACLASESFWPILREASGGSSRWRLTLFAEGCEVLGPVLTGGGLAKCICTCGVWLAKEKLHITKTKQCVRCAQCTLLGREDGWSGRGVLGFRVGCIFYGRFWKCLTTKVTFGQRR